MQRKLAEQEEAIANLWGQPKHLKRAYVEERAVQQATVAAQQRELMKRQQAGEQARRCEQGVRREGRQPAEHTARFQRRRRQWIECLCLPALQ